MVHRHNPGAILHGAMTWKVNYLTACILVVRQQISQPESSKRRLSLYTILVTTRLSLGYIHILHWLFRCINFASFNHICRILGCLTKRQAVNTTAQNIALEIATLVNDHFANFRLSRCILFFVLRRVQCVTYEFTAAHCTVNLSQFNNGGQVIFILQIMHRCMEVFAQQSRAKFSWNKSVGHQLHHQKICELLLTIWNLESLRKYFRCSIVRAVAA